MNTKSLGSDYTTKRSRLSSVNKEESMANKINEFLFPRQMQWNAQIEITEDGGNDDFKLTINVCSRGRTALKQHGAIFLLQCDGKTLERRSKDARSKPKRWKEKQRRNYRLIDVTSAMLTFCPGFQRNLSWRRHDVRDTEKTGRPRAICCQRYPLPCFARLWIGVRGSRAAAPKGTMTCRTQRTFLHSFVHEICPLRPEIYALRPKICPPRPWI